MSHIEVKMKDGTTRTFKPSPRPGGSYTKTVKYEGAFVIITDEYHHQTAIPAADVAEVKTWPDRY